MNCLITTILIVCVPSFVYRINTGSEKDGVKNATSNQICHSHIRACPVNGVLSATVFLQGVHQNCLCGSSDCRI